MKKILFVCTGNTCRSPMAEAVFNKKAHDKGVDAVAFSAGLFADSSPLSSGAHAALSDFGITDFQHISKQLSEEMLCECDYVVGISARHAAAVADNFPKYADKVFAFPTDISDPFGMSTQIYKKTLSEIEDGIDTIISELFGK